jgi:anaphase-promoting complex subunit 4
MMTSRAICSASWLSAAARRELSHFKEFMKWLRFGRPDDKPSVLPDVYLEIGNASLGADPQSANQLRHDVLEVNEYLTTGLGKSEIDAWFRGGVPSFLPQDLGVPDDKQNLPAAIERARSALRDPSQTAWAHVRFSMPYPLLNPNYAQPSSLLNTGISRTWIRIFMP